MRCTYIVILYLLFFSACAEEKIYPDKYNLNFSSENLHDFKWSNNLNEDYCKVNYSWLRSKDGGESVFYISEHASPMGGDSTLDLVAEMNQKITLYKEYEELKAGIVIKTQNIDVAWLKITCLDQNEDVLRKDSTSIINQDWMNEFLIIDLESTAYIVVDIYAHSLKNDEKESHLRIHNISLHVDGKNINEVNHSANKEVELLPKNIIPLCTTDINNIQNIAMLSAKELSFIGLGETFHGSSTIERVRNQVIQNMVLHNNCKLILFECPTAIVLKWHLFINGYDIDKEELLEDLIGSSIPYDALIELLNWLREYNANNSSQMVQLVGIDIVFDESMTTYLIHDYLFYLNKHKKDPILEELLHKFYNAEDGVGYYSFLETNQETLEKAMGDFEYKWFLNFYNIYLNLPQMPGYMENGLWNSRDYFMWLNFECAIKLGLQNGEKAVLTGHWGHINKINLGDRTTPTLGYYINQHYGNKYKAIGLLGGEGRFFSHDDWLKSSIFSLDKPPIGSLEAAAMESDVPYFFYPTSQLPSTPLLMRFNPQGFVHNQFIENSVKTRMDGIIFIRKCEGWTPSSLNLKLSDLKKIFTKRANRMRERGEQLLDKKKYQH